MGRTTTQIHWRKALLLSLASCAALLGAAQAQSAQTDIQVQGLEIEEGPLRMALLRLGDVAGVNIFASDDLVAGKRAQAVSGAMSIDEALSQVLAGSGLIAEPAPGGGYMLVQASEADGTISQTTASSSSESVSDERENVDTEETRVLDTITVSSFDRTYLANKGQQSAVGLDLTQLETPAAISIIPQDLLQDQQVNNVDDALRNVAGLVKFKTGNGGDESFSIRGFPVGDSIYKDGARRSNSLIVSNIPSTETANLDRIEVLKGPAALIYGQGSPGGIVNYIAKRPETERKTSIELLAASYDFYKLEADTTGAVPGTNDTLSYRLVGAYEDSESFRDSVERERLLINPSLYWIPNEDFSLLLGYEYIDDNYTIDRGHVMSGTLFGGYFYDFERLDESVFFGIPGFNNQTVAESKRIYAIANYQLLDNWRIEATYGATDNDKDTFDASAGFISGFPNIGFIGAVGSPLENLAALGAAVSVGTGKTEQFTLKNYVDFTDGFGFDHQILVSYDDEESETNAQSFGTTSGTVFLNTVTRQLSFDSLEAANPDFVQPGPIELSFGSATSSTESESNEQGLNIVDYITLNDQWAILIGGRFSEFENVTSDFQDDSFNVRGGIIYTPRDDLSFYASYAEGYSPSGNRLGLDDRQIDPELSVSYELGGKLALRDEQFLFSAVVFETTRQGIPFVANPFDENGNGTPAADIRFGNIGEVRTRGVEIEATGQITDNWRIIGGYAYNENEIIEGERTPLNPIFGGFQEGNELGGVPQHNFNIYTFYDIEVAGGKLGLGGGIFANSDVFISAENIVKHDGWVQTDLATYYKRGNWKAQLNVNNVFDEFYLQAFAGATSDFAGAFRTGTSTPRTVTASIAVEF